MAVSAALCLEFCTSEGGALLSTDDAKWFCADVDKPLCGKSQPVLPHREFTGPSSIFANALREDFTDVKRHGGGMTP